MTNLSKYYEDTQRLSEEESQRLLSQLTNCVVQSTVSQDDDEEAWVKNRTKGIGGSDVGSILGVNQYSSARLTYFKKTGQFQDSEKEFSPEAKERMAWGHKLEPLVADEFQARTGHRIVVSPATLSHKDYPWALANVDRFIVDEHGNPLGVLEVKTANARLNKDWEEGEIPMSYIYQLQWYLWITGLEYGAFAALVGGNTFYYYEVYRNDDLLLNEIVPACDKFWNYNVLGLVEPELSGSKADTEDIKDRYAEVVKNSEIGLPEDEMDELAKIVFEGKQQIKQLENVVDQAANKLKDKMQQNELGYTQNHTIKWSPRSQTRVDSAMLKSEFPEIYDQVCKQISFRVFQVK